RKFIKVWQSAVSLWMFASIASYFHLSGFASCQSLREIAVKSMGYRAQRHEAPIASGSPRYKK
ncbi:MAG: hypothetical protein ACP5J1_05510, partial [Fervidicoccaceae archaeon]